MKKMMRFVKGKGKDKDSDKKSVSSFGSRSSLAMSTSQLNNAGKEDIIGCFDFVCISLVRTFAIIIPHVPI